VSINRAVLEYDHVLIASPVVPHEAMGFAGGNKYFFPGVGGLDIIETFHWLAAVITNPAVERVKDTATAAVIDRPQCSCRSPAPAFAFAVDGHGPAGVSVSQESGRRLVPGGRLLRRNSTSGTSGSPARRVLGITPDIYEELWVGGKAMYKLEPVVADWGLALSVYGPQIREISSSHGDAIRRIGYHVRDYFLGQWERFRNEPKLIRRIPQTSRGRGYFRRGDRASRASA